MRITFIKRGCSELRIMDCLDCDLKQKLFYCCGNHPLTGKTKILEIGNVVYEACVNLNEDGLCSIYDNRPEVCRRFECGAHLDEK